MSTTFKIISYANNGEKFLSSLNECSLKGAPTTQQFQAESNYRQAIEEDVTIYYKGNDSPLTFDDSLILKIIEHNNRHNNFYAYVLDQPQNLPFGNSREDILVVGPEYEDKE
jgi:hypothetical protein